MFRALALGDLLCAVPALRAMRAAWPRAEILLVGLPGARDWVQRFGHYVNGFIEFPGWPGLPERPPHLEQIPGFLADMQARRLDLAIQLHGSGTIVNSLVVLFGAERTAGFYPPGYYCLDPQAFLPWPDQGLEIQRLLALVDLLGVERRGDALEFPLSERDSAELWSLAQASVWVGQPYVVIHPGASTPLRRWPIENFVAVADAALAAGYRVAVTGVESERSLADTIVALSPERAVNLAGRTSLGALGALVKEAAVVICNDTSVSHIAAALKTPSVIISTGNNPARWAPVDRRLHRVLCDDLGVPGCDVVQAMFEQLELAPAAAPPDHSSERLAIFS